MSGQRNVSELSVACVWGGKNAIDDPMKANMKGTRPRLLWCMTLAAAVVIASFGVRGVALAQNDAVPGSDPAQQDFVTGQQDFVPDQQDYMSEANSQPADENQGVQDDPLAPFNEKMFTFNLKLDEWVLRPVATGYAAIAPKPVRQSVGRFFENSEVIKNFSNNLFQLRLPQAGEVAARFAINSTLGLAGFFDPAQAWFGLQEHRDDFGLTLRYYGAPTGPYVMLPLVGPSTVGDTIGIVVDHVMNPMDYLIGWPWYIEIPVSLAKRGIEAVNYRSLRMDQFEAADRYAVDLYGAVQDAYLQTRAHEVDELSRPESASPGKDSGWALIAAPSLSDFPDGNWDTPRGQWLQVSAYSSEAGCRDTLEKRGSMGEERPLDCISTATKEYAQIVSNVGH